MARIHHGYSRDMDTEGNYDAWARTHHGYRRDIDLNIRMKHRIWHHMSMLL